MGAWGAGIFEDDTACDIRDEFAELLGEGMSAEAVADELERRYEPASDKIDVEPVFWIALAAAQHHWGRLVPAVRDKAIEIIDSGRDLERFFDEPKIREKRAAALTALKTTLNGPPRPLRKIKPVTKVFTSWPPGLVLRYRLASGRSCLFRVVGHKEDKGGRYAIFEVLRENSDRPPSALRIALTQGALDKAGKLHQIIVPSRPARALRKPTSDDPSPRPSCNGSAIGSASPHHGSSPS
jgi:hypothetical protein